MKDVAYSSGHRISIDMKQFAQAGILAGAVSVVGNWLIFAVSRFLGFGLMVAEGPNSSTLVPLENFQVVVSSFFPAIFATFLLALLHRYSKSPWWIFYAISTVFFLVSFYPVFAFQMDGAATRATLFAMHVVAAVSIVGTLSRKLNK